MKLYNISKPCTIWADPNGFLTRPNLWDIIKECEDQFQHNVERKYPDCAMSKLYIMYRHDTRLVVLKHRAQSNAPSLSLNASRLLDRLKAKDFQERKALREDIKLLEDFRIVYDGFKVLHGFTEL